MAKSIAFAADASRLASLLLSYIPTVCAFVAPRQPGASTAIIDRPSRSRALNDPETLQPMVLRCSRVAHSAVQRRQPRWVWLRAEWKTAVSRAVVASLVLPTSLPEAVEARASVLVACLLLASMSARPFARFARSRARDRPGRC
jgi:hypothetical protein